MAIAIGLVVAFGAGAFTIAANLLLASPSYVNYAAGHVAGAPVNMTIQADPTTGFGTLAPSVTYMAMAKAMPLGTYWARWGLSLIHI